MRLTFLPQNFRVVISLALVLLISYNTNAQIITTFAGNGTPGWSGDGTPATSAAIKGPNAVMVDGSGNVFICDANNNRVRMISPSGIISEIAGNGTPGFFGDGGPATAAEFNDPTALAMDVFGNLYVADLYNQVVRKISPAIGGTITTIAGTPVTIGYFGDGGPATSAKFHNPYGLSFDSYGDLYIIDQYNHAVRKITMSTGIINTFAGTGVSGFGGDGKPASVAQLSYPNCVYIDGYDNVFISDNGNQRIRKVNTVDTIYTVAGNGTIGFFGDTGPATNAELNYQAGMKVDALGNLYICDQGNNRIRKVNSSGIINTIAGNGTPGYVDGVPVLSCEMHEPLDIAIDHSGNVFIADYSNNRIREIPSGNHPPAFTNGHNQAITICENSGADTINSLLAITDPDAGQTETWTLHSGPLHGTAFVSYTTTSTGGTLTPKGLYYTPATGYSGLDSFKVWVNDGSSVDSTKVVVTIGPFPGPGIISGPSMVCMGSTITLSDAIGGGAWSSSNTDATISGGVVTGLSAGTVTISYTVSGSCGSGTATYNIIVNPFSGPGTISGPSAVCVGSMITLSDGAGGGTWSSSNTNVAIAGGVVTGVSVGAVTISYTVSGTCASGTATYNITVNPFSGPGIISGPSAVCQGSAITLTDATGGGTWSSSNAHATVSGGVVIGVSAGAVTISYTVSGTCAGGAATYNITVNPFSGPGIIFGPLAVCQGSTIILSDATGGGTWSSSNTNVTISGGVVTGISAGAVTISYTVSGTCASGTATYNITVNPFSGLGIISGPSTVCTGSTITLSDVTGGGTWNSSNAHATISGGVVTGMSAGADTISYAITSTCVSGTATYNITITPATGIITGPTDVCSGMTITLSDAATGGIWSSPGYSGIVSIDPATGIVTGVGSGMAIITYAIGTGCMATAAVSVKPLPPPITGPALGGMCAGGEKMYAYDADTTYGSWTSTFVTINTSGLVTDYNAGVGILTYTLPTGCFTTASLTVMPLPGLIAGTNAVCSGNTTILSDTVSGGVWSPGHGSIAVVSGTGVVSGISAGTVIITYALPTGCFMTDTISVYTSPTVITGFPNACVGATTTLSDAVSGGIWSTSGGDATVGMSTGIVTGISAGAAMITYTTTGGCTALKTITVLPLPNLYGVTGGGSYCAGGAGMHVGLSGSDIGVKYKLYNGGAVIDSLMGTGGLLDFGTETLAGTYTITAANTATTCSNGMSGSATVIINPVLMPSVSISQTPGDTVCAGTAIVFTAIPVNGGTPVFQWKVNGVNTGIGGTYSYTPVNGDAVIVLMTSNAPCASPVLADTFVNVPVFTPTAPVFTITENPGLSIELGQPVTFTATVTNGATDISYQWLLNGTSVPGETAATYTSSNLANYDKVSCKVTSSISDCGASASEVVEMAVLNDGEGVKPLTPKGEPAIWPNPVRDELIVSNAANSEMRIYNLLGQEVFSAGVFSDEEVLSIGDLTPGVYLVHVIGNNGLVMNVRLVKE